MVSNVYPCCNCDLIFLTWTNFNVPKILMHENKDHLVLPKQSLDHQIYMAVTLIIAKFMLNYFDL